MEAFFKPPHVGWLSTLVVTAFTTLATLLVLISKKRQRDKSGSESDDDWDQMLGI